MIAASILENRFFGIASEQKHHPERIEVENIPGMDAVHVRWIVQGKEPFTVTVDSEKGGSHSLKSR